MANTIALFKQYTALLDEVYKQSALTSKIDGASDLATQALTQTSLSFRCSQWTVLQILTQQRLC